MKQPLTLSRGFTIPAADPPLIFQVANSMTVSGDNKAGRRGLNPVVVPRSVYGRADFEYGMIKELLPGVSQCKVFARTLGPEYIISDAGSTIGDDKWHSSSMLISGIVVPCFSAPEFSTVPFKGKMLGLFNMAHPQLQQDMIGHTAKTIYKSLHKSHHYLANDHLLQKIMDDHTHGIPANTASFMVLLEIYASGMPSVNMESGRPMISGILGTQPQPGYSVYCVGESSGTQSSSHGDHEQLPGSSSNEYTVIPVICEPAGAVDVKQSFFSGLLHRIYGALSLALASVQGHIPSAGRNYSMIPANDIEAQRLNGMNIPAVEPGLSDQVSIGIAAIGATIDIGVLVKSGAKEYPSTRDYVVSYIALVGFISCILPPFMRGNNPKRAELILKLGAAATVASLLVLNASVFKNVAVGAVAAFLVTLTVSVLICV